jgi:hypothetical protein
MGLPSPRLRRAPQGAGVLRHLAALLNLAGRRLPERKGSAPMRRRRQRLALAQRLLDPLPPGLHSGDGGAELFWRVLRWGGLGLMVAWLLRR